MKTTILDYFERTCDTFSDKKAYCDESQEITFSGLKIASKKIAAGINNRVEKMNCPIIVFMDREVRTVVSFLGVVYSGNFYVPIDPDMPKDRVAHIVNNASPMLVIYSEESKDKLIESGLTDIQSVTYETLMEETICESVLSNIRKKMKSTDLLYVLYTSGSTGVPKGVAIPHLAVMDFMEWVRDTYGFSEDSVLCNQAPFYFDASVPDLYIPIISGAATYIPPRSYYTFPQMVLKYIDEHQINTLIWVPSALCNVVNMGAFDVSVPETIKLVIFCGEVMPCKYLNKWREKLPDAKYVNMYGPTEATYACTYFDIDELFSDEDVLPLGRACGNSEILLINDGKKCEKGEIGEICVMGQCLSSGYYHDREKTAESFVQNPLNENYIELMYKTGDLAYENNDGLLIFAGRKDSQIKRLGHRIELGEIENVIWMNENVENGCCLFDKENSDIIAVFSGDIDEKELDSYIGKKLPPYMKPTRYEHMDHLPMNLNGKVDRAMLKETILQTK